MLFIGNQRSGAASLADHLLNERDNEHVEVHEVRGFASDTVHGAFNEIYAISKGTKCEKYLYSLSINPPPHEEARTEDFEMAANRAEERLGLTGQPRVIVFHEKEGRRHAHAVWSRIDSDKMKAIPLSYDHPKLQEVSRELYLEHGWRMPRGMTDKSLRDPRSFSLDEWQQAKRQGKDPREIKAALQDAWAMSDSRSAFSNALKERGYTLARGDRRGFVAVDHKGDVFAIGKKWLGVKSREIKDRLGDPKELQTVETAKAQIAQNMQTTLSRHQKELGDRRKEHDELYERRKADLIQRQQQERKAVFEKFETRRLSEVKERQERFRTGLQGLWDKVRGEQKRIQARNEREAYQSLLRDRAEKDTFINRQLQQRQSFEHFRQRETDKLQEQQQALQLDQQHYLDMSQAIDQKKQFMETRQADFDQSRSGPELER